MREKKFINIAGALRGDTTMKNETNIKMEYAQMANVTVKKMKQSYRIDNSYPLMEDLCKFYHSLLKAVLTTSEFAVICKKNEIYLSQECMDELRK